MKLLFVMSRDFGELTNALCFTMGQGFDSVFLVPGPVYELEREGLTVPTFPYESVDDVLAAVDRSGANVVLLFSGYLYVNNGLCSLLDLERLVSGLQRRGCHILTSDPWLGLMAHVDEHTFQVDPSVRKQFAHDFARVYALLQPFPHLYHVDLKQFATTEVLAFSNPNMVQPAAPLSCPPEVYRALGLDPTRPRWLFVLGGHDYWAGTTVYGTTFDDLLTDQMYEALHQGRQPVLIAPPACTSAVALRSSPADGLVLLPFCRHDRFLSVLLEAEYVFYWNQISNSALLIRAANRRPVFFFDRGHMARACPSFFPRGVQCYYPRGCPPCLPLTEPLEADQLARCAAEQAVSMNAVADNLLTAPTPAEVLRRFQSV